MVYILGVNLLHDTSAALIENGKIIAAVEERFNRQKHTTSFPKKSIDYCLNEAGIKLDDVDYICTSFDFERFRDNSNPFEYNTISHDDATAEGRGKILADNNSVYLRIKGELEKNGIGQWLGVPHHLAHAAGAYCLSGFKKSNIIVIDGRGENEATSLMYGNGGKIEIVDQYLINDSLGHLYTYITYLCGLYSNIGQEGKTMSLAAYGKPNPELEAIFNKILTFEGDKYRINREAMRQLIKYKLPLGRLNDISKDMAYAVQKNYEKALIFLARKLKDKTGCNVYSLSGGVCLNSVGNGKLLSQDFVREMYIQPAANDAGTAVGAALYRYGQLKNLKPAKQEDVYLGPRFTNEEIEDVLKQSKIR